MSSGFDRHDFPEVRASEARTFRADASNPAKKRWQASPLAGSPGTSSSKTLPTHPASTDPCLVCGMKLPTDAKAVSAAGCQNLINASFGQGQRIKMLQK
jgi:hypothetical protein